MLQSNGREAFSFLTPTRIRAIKQGLNSGNADHDEMTADRRHLQDRLNPYHRGTGRRPWFVAHMLESLSDDDGVCEFDVSNMQGIVFDGTYACRFKRVNTRLDKTRVDKARIFDEPEVFRRARERPSPPKLPLDDEEMPEVTPPLSDLILIDVGYFVRDDNVEELYFVLHDEDSVVAMEIVSLYEEVQTAATVQPAVSRPQLRLNLEEEDAT